MRYWWVNHKLTFRHEFNGGYVWAPKRKKNGAKNRFYDFLKEVVPGDVVFSFAGAVLRGAGFVVSYCYTCPQPQEFGRVGEAWDVLGWRVDVQFRPFERPFRPKDLIQVLGPLIQREECPAIRETGDGLQHVYFTSVSSGFAEVLLGLAGSGAEVFRGDVMQDSPRASIERELTGIQEWEDVEQRKINLADIPPTTRTALIKARVGQGLFKERVSRLEAGCRITFVNNPTHLIGSHIKPWRECNNEERLQGTNGLLLTPSADHLFDRGFISFADNGDILVSRIADLSSLKRMGVDPDRPPQPRSFNQDQKHFLDYHRREVFLGV